MDVLRGDVFEVDIVDLGADLDILCHPGRRDQIAHRARRVSRQLTGIIAFFKEFPARLTPPFGVDFFDAFHYLKEAGSAGYPVGFQGWRNRKADGFLGAADIRDYKVCCHRVKAALHALDGRVIRL